MPKTKRIFLLFAFLGAAVLSTASPVNAAPLTSQEQRQVASLLSTLDSISALLNQFKNKIFGTASAQTTGSWVPITGSARSSTTDGKSGHFEIISEAGGNFIYALGKTGGGIFRWNKSISDPNPSSGNWEGGITGGGGNDVFKKGPDGKFYLLGENGGVFRWDGGSPGWTSVSGDGVRTSVLNSNFSGHFEILNDGGQDFIYALGGNAIIFKWSKPITDPNPLLGNWGSGLSGPGVTDVFKRGPDGKFYAMHGNGAVSRWEGSTWTQVTGDGARTTSNFGKSGHFEIIGEAGGNFIYALGQLGNIARWNKSITDPNPLSGGWVNIVDTGAEDVFKKGPDGKFYALTANGVVFRWDATGAGPFTLTVTKAGTGSGTVTSAPTGINCGTGGTDCTKSYANNTSVTLTAAVTASSGSTFAGWGGDCLSAGTVTTCALTMSAAKNVTATFNTIGGATIAVTSPNGGEVWQKGTTQTITWTSSNVSQIYIKLRKGSDTYPGSEDSVTGTIANTGSYQWTIPSTLPDGSDYTIRVINDIGTVIDDSNAPFTIQTAGGANTAPLGFIDIPAGNAAVSGTVTVEGWVADKEDGQVDKVFLAIDGAAVVPALSVQRYQRPDHCANQNVRTQLGFNTQNDCDIRQQQSTGWGVRLSWNTATISNGSHVIAFTAVDSGNLTTTGIGQRTVTVNNAGGDTTPPVRSNGFPTGTLPAGTTQTPLQLATNENATCKYGVTPNQSYANKPFTFSPANTTSHSVTVTGLTNGSTHTFYVRCQDTASPPNTNTDDYTITFSVATPGVTPPSISTLAPNQGLPGVSVNITGTGFAPPPAANTVNFNGSTIPAGFVQSSGTADPILFFTVPSSATQGAKNISVTNSNGTSNGLTFTVTSTGGGGNDGSATPALENNDLVRTTVRLKIRNAPSSAVSIRPSSPAAARATGRINCSATPPDGVTVPVVGTNCPTIFQGAVWWYVDYDTEDDGWSAEQFGESEGLLEKVSAPGGTPTFQNGDRARGVQGLRIRSDPSISLSTSISQITNAAGEVGAIVGGPAAADNYIWWQVDWDNVNLPTGWSAEADPQTGLSYLNKITGGGGGQVQLFMDPDGPGSAPPQIGTVQSKFRGSGGLNAAAFLRRAIVGNTGAILPSAMVADLSWNSPASSCTLLEEVTFLGLSSGAGAYSAGDYFSPVTFRFPNVPGSVPASDSVKAVIPIRFTDTAGALVDSPYETKFTLECGGVRSNTITAMFAPADIRKSDDDFTKPAYGGQIAYPYMITGPVVKADIKAATSNAPMQFSDTSGAPCVNFGGGTAVSCNLMILWSSLNATECTISGLGSSSAYDWGVMAAFGSQNTASVYSGTTKQLTCRNSTETPTSDSVTVPFP